MRKSDLRIQIHLALASLDRGWKGATKGLTVAQMKDMLQGLRREQIQRGIIKPHAGERDVVIEVSDHGTVVGFFPKTKDADELLHSVGASSYQWMGNTLYMDHRVAQDFIAQVSEEGGRFVR
jgi:hypothetical protein